VGEMQLLRHSEKLVLDRRQDEEQHGQQKNDAELASALLAFEKSFRNIRH
jgi:hypothetical protein